MSNKLNDIPHNLMSLPTVFNRDFTQADLSSSIDFFEDGRSFLNKRSYFVIQPRHNYTTLSTTTIGLPLDGFHIESQLVSDALIKDLNFTLNSSLLYQLKEVSLEAVESTFDKDIFLTSDFLNYYPISQYSFLDNA